MSKVEKMEEALKIDLILEKVCELSSFETLKKLRLVNKYWNKISSRVTRKRCDVIVLSMMGDYRKYYKKLHAHLKNPEITVKIPIEASIKCGGWWSMLDDLLKNMQWRANIVYLHLHSLTIPDANRLTPFVLQQLTSLTELYLMFDYSGFEYNVPTDRVTVPEVPTDAKFPMLESVKIQFYHVEEEHEGRSFVLDPMYLRQCTALKKFSILINRIPGAFVRFFAEWKKMYLEDPDLHRYQHVIFQMIEMDTDTLPEDLDLQPMMNAIIEFININQPTSLELSGDFDYNFPTLFPKIERWYPGIQSLLTNIPVHAVDRKFRADFLFKLLKKYEVFADLTEICLRLSRERCMPLNEIQVGGPAKHHLSRVISLEVESNGICNTAVLQQAALRLPTVTRLTLSELDFDVEDNDELDLEAIFKAVEKFSGLRKLCVEMEALDGELKWRKLGILKRNEKGYFKNISAIKGLTDLKLTVLTSPVRKDTALVSLFHGYEPHVRLELHIVPWKSWLGRIPKKPRHKLQLSTDEFKETLRKAEAKLIR